VQLPGIASFEDPVVLEVVDVDLGERSCGAGHYFDTLSAIPWVQ
jgi:hypothetical protein